MGDCMSSPGEGHGRKKSTLQGKAIEGRKEREARVGTNTSNDKKQDRDLSTRSVEEYNDFDDLPRLPDGPTNQTVNPV